MGRPCARQSNIPRPPFPRRNRLDEVHAARSAQTIRAFRRGGCHPPAGRTLCAPTLRVLFLGRVELQVEVRDMGPGRRCHAAARSRAGSLSLRLGLVSGPPRGPVLALAPLQAPLLTACALLIVTLRIGRMAGSITPTTPPKPTRAWGAPWAFGIRSVVISPVRLWVALLYHAAAAAQRAAVPTPFVPAGHFPLTGGIGPAVRNTNTRAFSPPWFVFSLRSIRAAPHASALKFDAWR